MAFKLLGRQWRNGGHPKRFMGNLG